MLSKIIFSLGVCLFFAHADDTQPGIVASPGRNDSPSPAQTKPIPLERALTEGHFTRKVDADLAVWDKRVEGLEETWKKEALGEPRAHVLAVIRNLEKNKREVRATLAHLKSLPGKDWAQPQKKIETLMARMEQSYRTVQAE